MSDGFEQVSIIKNQVREILRKKGYLVDSYFEGDYETWVGSMLVQRINLPI